MDVYRIKQSDYRYNLLDELEEILEPESSTSNIKIIPFILKIFYTYI